MSREPKFVYFILSTPACRIKIGCSSDPHERMEGLRKKGQTLELLGCGRGGFERERKLHRKFLAYRMNGEWFMDCRELRLYAKRYLRLTSATCSGKLAAYFAANASDKKQHAEELGKSIVAWRGRVKYSRSKAAKILGTTSATLAKIERGMPGLEIFRHKLQRRLASMRGA